MVRSPSSMELIERAMSLSVYRQKLLASNIANVDTPGYKRFDLAMQQALRNADKKPKERFVYNEQSSSLRADGNNVDIEQEMAVVAANSLYFEALSTALNKQLSTMRYLISEGRR